MLAASITAEAPQKPDINRCCAEDFGILRMLKPVGQRAEDEQQWVEHHIPGLRRADRERLRPMRYLMLIGVAHLFLIWNGDILFEYAIAGFIVLPFLFGPSRMPAIAGVGLLVLFIAAPFLPPVATTPSRSWMIEDVVEATRIYCSGGFMDVFAFRIRELPGFCPSTYSCFREQSP